MSVQKGLKLKPKMHHTETTKQRKKEIEWKRNRERRNV